MPSAYAVSSSSCARARRSSRLRSPGRSRSRPEVMYAGRPIAASPRPSRPMRGNLAPGGHELTMTQSRAAGSEAAQGQFTRDSRYITTRITADGRDGYPVEPGRYRLVVSRACPWASRAVIVRRLLGLEDVLSMGDLRADPRRAQLDLRPRPRRARPGARHRAAAGGLLRPLPRLRPGASPCRRSSTCRPGRWSPTTSRRSPSTCSSSGGATTGTARRTSTRPRCGTRWTR